MKEPPKFSPKRRDPEGDHKRRLEYAHRHRLSTETKKARRLARARWKKEQLEGRNLSVPTTAKQKAMDKGLHGDRGRRF